MTRGTPMARAAATRVNLLIGVLSVGALVLGFRSLSLRPTDRPVTLRPLEHPPLASLEPAVQEVIQVTRERLESVLASLAGSSRLLRARAYGEMGRVYHAHELWPPAGTCYENARRLQPDEYRWHDLVGRVLMVQGDREAAADALERGLELCDRDLSATVADGVSLSLRLARIFADLGRAERARVLAERARAADPGSTTAMSLLGELLLAAGQTDRALELMEEALVHDPHDRALATRLATALARAGREDAAVRMQHRVRRVARRAGGRLVDPLGAWVSERATGSKTLAKRARDLESQGRPAEAARRMARAVALCTRDRGRRGAYRSELVGLLLGQGAIPAARAALEALREDDPGHARLPWVEARVLAAEGRPEEALRLLDGSPSPDAGGEPGRSLLRSELLEAAGRQPEAVTTLETAVAGDPGNPVLRRRLAALLITIGRFGEARSRLEAAHREIPGAGGIRVDLARLLAAAPEDDLRDGPRALALVEPLMASLPSGSRSEAAALALAETGRFPEALAVVDQALASARRAGETDALPRLESQRDHYARGQPWRLPVPPGSPEPSVQPAGDAPAPPDPDN